MDYAKTEPERADFVSGLPETFESGQDVLHAGRNTIKRFVLDGRSVVVKRFKRNGLLMRIIRTLGHSNKAQRSYDNAQELIRRGFDTPKPIEAVVEHGLGGITDAYYLCAETNKRAIREELQSDNWNRDLAASFGRFVARMHQSGVLHRDLNNTNVLWEKVGEEYRFELIDVNRMDFYDTKIPDEDCMENLTMFTGRMDLFLMVAQSYAEARSWSWEQVDKACVNKLKHDLRYRRIKRMRHPFRKAMVLVLLTALGQMVSAQCTQEVKKQDKAAFEKAVAAYESKHFVEANAQLKKLAARNPKSADVNFYLGMIAARLDVNPAAIKRYFSKTIDLCPDYPNALAHYYMGVIHYSAEQYEQAVTELNRYFDMANGSGRPDYEAVYEEASSYLHWSQFLAEAELNKSPFAPQLLKGVSSKEDELLPYITWDGKTCYFLRMVKEKRPASFYDDQMAAKVPKMMISRKSGENFGTGDLLPAPFNMNENEGGVTITCDNGLLFYSVVKTTRSGYGNCDIYYSEFKGGAWGDIKALGGQVNGEKSWESQPSITPDGQTLYFASNRPGGQGGIDIWKCHKLPNGDWSRAENLGPSINTPGNEKCPFIHADGHTLYFASDGWQGFGGYDMYFANMNDNSAAYPTNMGLPINTEEDDICLGVIADGSKAYFAGKQPQAEYVGGKDVYVFDLYPAARPEPMKVMKAPVKCDKPVSITVSRFGAENAVYAGSQVMLSLKEENLVVAEAEGYLPAVGCYGSAFVKTNGELPEVALRPIALKEGLSLADVKLAGGASQSFAAGGKAILDAYAKFLIEHPMIRVEINGCDVEYSRKVRDYLLSKKLRNERITIGLSSKSPKLTIINM